MFDPRGELSIEISSIFLLNHGVHFPDVSSLQMLRKGQDALNVVGVGRGMKGVMKDLELSPFTVADR